MAKKISGPSISEKLLKSLEKLLAPTGPLITSVKIWPTIRDLFRFYLHANQNSETARNHIAQVALHFRAEAQLRFQQDTIETFELAQMIKEPTSIAEQRGRLDAMSHIAKLEKVSDRLDVEQQSAAEEIQEVWQAFAKGLEGGSRDLSRTGGSGRVLHPLDTMEQELWEHYQGVYIPWVTHATKTEITRRYNGTPVSVATIVLRILVADLYPEAVDQAFDLTKGRALAVLHAALANYRRPEAIRGILCPPQPKAAAKSSPPTAVSAAGEQSPAPKAKRQPASKKSGSAKTVGKADHKKPRKKIKKTKQKRKAKLAAIPKHSKHRQVQS